MKKLFALVLTIVLCAAMLLPAYAADAPTGTLTITNAEIGRTYTIVRVFDAQVSGTESNASVAYTVKNSDAAASLYQLIVKDQSYVKDGTTILNPFVVDNAHAASSASPVSHKTPAEGQSKEFGRGWLFGMYQSGAWVPDTGTVQTGSLEDAAINTLTFSNLPYGYYMVFADDATVASVLSITSANATINDKNNRTPSDPDKKIKIATGDLKDFIEGQVGDDVTYVSSFRATNYRTADRVTKQITSYRVSDTATALKYKGLDSVVLYSEKNADGTFSGKIADITDKVHYDAVSGKNGYSMEIPWVDDAGNSLYPAPCYVVFTYEMYLTEEALSNTIGNKATNTFSPSFVVDDTDVPLENPPHTEVYTTGLSLFKTDGENPLTGAFFKLAKVGEDGNEIGFYHQEDRSSSVTGETWKEVVWGEDEDALIVEAKNNADVQSFGGLKAGTYHLYETKAPDGYYAPAKPWTIVISYTEGTDKGTFSAKISAENGTPTELPLAASNKSYFKTTIINESTAPLPQTGAAGTTMLLICGAALFAGTMLLLVTKKRLYNENI